MEALHRIIGANLVAARVRAGVNRARLAATLGVEIRDLHAYQTGRRRIDAATMIQLCEILGVRPKDLMRGLISPRPRARLRVVSSNGRDRRV